MKDLIRKWLGIPALHSIINQQGENLLNLALKKNVTKEDVELMLSKHFEELQNYLKPVPAPPVEEPKPLVKRPRTWSSFRGNVEGE